MPSLSFILLLIDIPAIKEALQIYDGILREGEKERERAREHIYFLVLGDNYDILKLCLKCILLKDKF